MSAEKNLFNSIKEIERLFNGFLIIANEQLLLLQDADSKNDNGISEELLRLFEKRQKIIAKINILNARIQEYEEKAGLSVLKIDEISEIDGERFLYAEKKKKIIETIEIISNKDRESRGYVKKMMQDSSDKYNRAQKSKKAYDAYVPKEAYSEAWFFDKKK